MDVRLDPHSFEEASSHLEKNTIAQEYENVIEKSNFLEGAPAGLPNRTNELVQFYPAQACLRN